LADKMKINTILLIDATFLQDYAS